MNTPLDGSRSPLRATGICHRCRRHTNDGVLRSVEQGTGGSARALFCADLTVCDQKLPTPRG